jgi:hypothetical protein
MKPDPICLHVPRRPPPQRPLQTRDAPLVPLHHVTRHRRQWQRVLSPARPSCGGLADISRHVIQRILCPPFLICLEAGRAGRGEGGHLDVLWADGGACLPVG